jgi:DNA-binding transcriptional regulator YiaG
MSAKKHRGNIAGAVHEAIPDAFEADVIDKPTMRKFDESCLTHDA